MRLVSASILLLAMSAGAVHGAPVSEAVVGRFFIAPWCDWYVTESRPEMAANCVNARQ